MCSNFPSVPLSSSGAHPSSDVRGPEVTGTLNRLSTSLRLRIRENHTTSGTKFSSGVRESIMGPDQSAQEAAGQAKHSGCCVNAVRGCFLLRKRIGHISIWL
ncbi:hypothetical protein CDAR_59731 [Caerostris darwini]|uniref:Uncharacterized protein n=1 Tax=Caerostris darwini TaxID=1538125 RepID=A0AAV4RMS1_9ARAC|nr:hypothetical protein CDAR_59731 [Caerostris darwini]